MRHTVFILLISALLGTAACSNDSSSPTSPSTTLNLTGTYAGDITVQGAPARMVWTVTQTGNAVTGSVVVSLPSGTVLLNGAVSGTVTGTSIAYTIIVSPGGIPAQPACGGQLSGTATGTTTAPFTLSGNYNLVSSTCTSPLTSGTFALTRP